ncbi:MAG: peptidyl-prolyl cis-trans isomerase SurA, partial [Lentimonas sp.]
MKKQVLIFLSIIFTSLCFGQTKEVIMTVNDKGVTQSEFLQIYLKNNNNPKYDKATLDEYMDLFVKFKLKVAEAEALGYDTLPRLTKELLGYRKQLSTPYLTDSSMSEALVKEAYDRTLNEVKASHILVQIGQRPSQKDTTVAYERIMALRKRILAGEDFAAVAKGPNGSDDPSVKTNGGDLGFFTAFQMVTGFEDAAFNTPMGEVSMPIRTRFGYHIIKVMDRRQAHGTIYASHIMVAVTPNDSKNEKASALKKVSEIHEKLVNGENFEELAKKFSDDPSTNNKSGALPPFGSGSSTRMVANFEEAAFAIQKDGDFSDPILTDYGY